MIKLAILAVVLSIVASAAGAGIAGCRNSMNSARLGFEQALGGSPETPAQQPAAADAQAEIDMLRSALEQAAETMRAAERQIARIRQAEETQAVVESATRAAAATRQASVRPAATAAPVRTREPVRAPAARPALEAIEARARTPEPAPPALRIPRETLIAVTVDALTSSATAQVEDRVLATTTGDVRVDGIVVVPAGSRMVGSVTAVERSGRMRGSESISVRFHTLVTDGVEIPLATGAITRTGPGQGKQNATRIGGGAAIGAVLGGIFGGHKGAAVGGAIGGAGGTAAAAAQHAPPAVLQPGERLVLRTTRTATL